MTSLNFIDSGQFIESSTFFKIVFDEVFNKNSINLVPTNHCIDLDINENEESYFVSAYLPGVKEENIRLEHIANVLIINVKKTKFIPLQLRNNCNNGNFHYFRRGIYVREPSASISFIDFSKSFLKIKISKYP
ncbi:hypothetical protein [Clostridium manihotivorum]|uniref:Hsp20/alpha crystallin family protein n=1 Tax=Clostridium manihotivorum TaxID=2320868 RepID=A0A3R5WZH5_9CLOT|nr:hypothetical protein [Clostridium manihotivorum]QAA30432.1 hypothetical protein C1I91_01375 [Clostridium manihotivorum]